MLRIAILSSFIYLVVSQGITTDVAKPHQASDGVSEQPNEVIDEIRKIGQRLDRMENRVDHVMDTVGNLAQNLRSLTKRVDDHLHPHPLITTETPTTKPPTTTTPVDWVYYPPGTKENRAKRWYPENGLRFTGFFALRLSGCPHVSKKGISWEDCMKFCLDNRRVTGWKYCTYAFYKRSCYSFKIAKANRSKKAILYQFQ